MAPMSKMALGIKRASRSHTYHRRGLWAIKAKHGGAFPKAEKPAAVAEPKFYPADDVKPRTVSTRKPTGHGADPARGEVHGEARGVPQAAGPFKINGVPIRRVNQTYVIATSTKVDISKVNVQKFDDKYFAREKKTRAKKTEGELFESEKEATKNLPDFKKDDQKVIDAELIKAIVAVPDLKNYLGARFSLRDGDKPHEMTF
ncbi:unnamed protein product [Triticum turgidum subsp. durum]|uniref:60S ribosomal protein L6 n=1 Tax=Triticum turgidum subsp. durum TaxID=4567 RepID=A0A9R0Y180_TRITD|nr:unnamed protein product [Triticum turgidum subsp. durum]